MGARTYDNLRKDMALFDSLPYCVRRVLAEAEDTMYVSELMQHKGNRKLLAKDPENFAVQLEISLKQRSNWIRERMNDV